MTEITLKQLNIELTDELDSTLQIEFNDKLRTELWRVLNGEHWVELDINLNNELYKYIHND